MQFASDNAGPAHPAILAALAAANEGHAGSYGADPVTEAARGALREVFEAPEAMVHFVATGTAANSLSLACLTPPFATVFCADVAHIEEDECNAPEFYTGGAKLSLVPTTDGRMSVADLDAAIRAQGNRGVHGPARGPVALTQITERGTVYARADIAALAACAHGHGLKVHMDGARFANAVAAAGCTPAEMSWKAGVDVLSFGGTKNGLIGAEAVVFFDPDLGRDFEHYRKRGGHLFSKHRYLSAQIGAAITDGLWLDLAAKSNAAAGRLAEGLLATDGVTLAYPADVNMVFPRFDAARHRRLIEAGAVYHIWEGDLASAAPETRLTARLVCDWSTTEAEVDALLAFMRA